MVKLLSLIMLVGILALGSTVFAADSKKMLSGGYPGEEILIFPESLPGPKGDIVKFVVLGAQEIPKVSLDLGYEILENVEVTEIKFEIGVKFSGYFDMPEELYTIWINDDPIEWEVN